ncbi:phage major capsid protein [Nocardia asiatica]|uniref:phage major capsid protein n=1 Tax=Nocardia asiatica TaxID=209252 RepID=UPI000312F166|nr:phage major capsid protein [Nocardia asiatica]
MNKKLSIAEARAELTSLKSEASEIMTRAGGADLIDDDATRFDEITARATELSEYIEETAERLEQQRQSMIDRYQRGDYISGDGARQDHLRRKPEPKRELAGAKILTREQKLTDWSRDNGHADEFAGEQPNFDRWLRGVSTGDWHDAPLERALAEGTNSAGGYVVPSPIANQVLDLARNATRVVQAGALTVPMTSQTLRIPRLENEAAPSWRNENAAVPEVDLVFGAVTLQARSLTRMVKISRELLEDSDPSVSDVIARSFGAQLALELDRVALRGSGTAPEPRGLLNTSGITVTSHGANGAALNTYDWFLDAIGVVRASNYEPSAVILAPRSITSLSKLKDSQGAYLAPPAGLPPILPTKQVPTNLTVGTSNDTSEIYVGQWNMLAIGIRTSFALEVLRERFADNMQVAFLAHMRADVAVLQPAAFTFDVGVRP